MNRWILIAVLCAIPYSAHAQWGLLRDLQGRADCALETEATSLFDGYDDTSLKLRLHDGAQLVMTDSNADLGMGDIGLRVDNNRFVAADEVMDETNIVFTANVEPVVEQFIRGRQVHLFLRFWPSYPSKGLVETGFSLIGFTKAYNEYAACLGSLKKD